MEVTRKGRSEVPIDIDHEVIDSDAHIRESREDVVEYIEDGEAKRYVESMNPYPGDGWDRTAGGRTGTATVETPEDEAEIMEELSIDVSVISPTTSLKHGLVPDRDVAVALAQGYNDYLVDVWLDNSDVYKGLILVPVQDPRRGADEIDRLADENGMAGVLVPPRGPERGLGDERYDPIYEAAQRHDLPIMMHGGGTLDSRFSLSSYLHKFLEVHALSHPLQQLIQVTSILCRGVPERFPDLQFVSMEAGLSWVPYLYRLDTEFQSRPNEAPLLEKKPTEYFKEHFYVSLQPIEDVPGFPGFEYLVEFAGGWDRVLFASDWPHWDFDSPAAVTHNVPSEHQSKVFAENAREVLRL